MLWGWEGGRWGQSQGGGATGMVTGPLLQPVGPSRRRSCSRVKCQHRSTSVGIVCGERSSRHWPPPALGLAAGPTCPWGHTEVQPSAVAFMLAHHPLHLPAGPGEAVSDGPAARAGWSPAALGAPQGSSPGKVQHGLHHVGAVLGAGLAEQRPVGLRGQWVSVGSLLPRRPQGALAYHGQLLPVGCADPRRLRKAGPQVHLVPHQHERQWPLGGLREGRAAQDSAGPAASGCSCCCARLLRQPQSSAARRLPPLTSALCLGARCVSRPCT